MALDGPLVDTHIEDLLVYMDHRDAYVWKSTPAPYTEPS